MNKGVKFELEKMHKYLMEHKFPYHSVSVVHTDLGYELIFNENVKEYVSLEIREYAKWNGFRISYVA